MIHVCFSYSFKSNFLFYKSNCNNIKIDDILVYPDDLSIGDISNPQDFLIRKKYLEIIYKDSNCLDDFFEDIRKFHDVLSKPSENIMIWVDDNQNNICGLFYTLWFLKDYNNDVFIVNSKDHNRDNVSSIENDEIGQLIKKYTLLNKEKRNYFCCEWEKIKNENSGFRLCKNNNISSVSEDFLDNYILSKVTTGITLKRLLCNILNEDNKKISWGFFYYRIECLIRTKQILISDLNNKIENSLFKNI
ncbi:MAG: DUF1835 domain-containing protein [Lachnotalea sp.]